MGKAKGTATPGNRRFAKKEKKKIRLRRPVKPERTPRQIDRQRASTAFQVLGDLVQDIQSWAEDVARFRKNGVELKHQRLVSVLLKECRTSLNNCIRDLS